MTEWHVLGTASAAFSHCEPNKDPRVGWHSKQVRGGGGGGGGGHSRSGEAGGEGEGGHSRGSQQVRGSRGEGEADTGGGHSR